MRASELDEKKRKLVKLFYAKKFLEAQDLYEEIIPFVESDPEVRKLGGDIYFYLGNQALAIGEYRQAMELWLKKGEYNKARVIAQKIARLSPEDRDIHLTLADIYLKLNHKEKAGEEYGKYIEKAVSQKRKDLAKFLVERLKRKGLFDYLPSHIQALYSAGIDPQALFESVKGDERFKAFMVFLKKEVARGNRYDRYFSLILITSRKKRVFTRQERFWLHKTLEKTLRKADIFIVGDKWVFVILPETNKYGGTRALHRIKMAIGEDRDDYLYFFASFPEDGIYEEALVKKALESQVF